MLRSMTTWAASGKCSINLSMGHGLPGAVGLVNTSRHLQNNKDGNDYGLKGFGHTTFKPDETYQFVVGSKKIVIMPVCRRFLALSI